MYHAPHRKPAPRITRFWNRIPSFFGYAFRPVPLGLTLCLSLITIITANSIWNIIIYAVMLKYCFEVMEQTARGELSPPGLSYEVFAEGYELPAKQFFIYIFFFLLVASVGGSVGPVWALVLLLFGFFALPASTMTLAATHSMRAALNPFLLVTMIGRVGWPYLTLYAFLFFLGVGQETLQYFFENRVSPELFYPLANAVNLIFSIIMFHMMGYVLFQYHEQMGEPTPVSLQQEDPSAELLAHFDHFMAEGQFDAAREELRGLIKQEPNNLALRRRTHNFLLAHPSGDDLARHGRDYLPLLLRNGDLNPAAEIYLDCLKIDTAFRPKETKLFLPLARALREMGRPKEAVQLAQGFHKAFPDNENTPPLYLLTARILCEDLNRDDLAKKMLSYLIKSFPGHALSGEIRSYLDTVRRLTST